MSVLEQEERDFLLPFPSVESEHEAFWREDEVAQNAFIPWEVGGSCGSARMFEECVTMAGACCEVSLHAPDGNESEQVRW